MSAGDMPRVLTAMSGGVDSSVAALLVKRGGYEGIGVTLKLFAGEDGPEDFRGERACCSLEGVEAARSVANALGMPFYVFNFSEDFRREVIERFVRTYQDGGTPNPCINCNRYVKLGKLIRRAQELDCGYVATGHYARVERDPVSGRWLLRKGLDGDKDQSYFLCSLSQEQLSRLMLPLGGLSKARVRELAEEAGFQNAQRRESQDICFVPDGDYAGFIERYTGKTAEPGDFVDVLGQVCGRHRGIIRYTVGQRRGLGLSFPQPMYVCGIDPVENRVVLGEESELFSRKLTARDLNFIAAEGLPSPVRVTAKIRHRHGEQPATAVQTGPDELEVRFDSPQRAVTRGQAVVLYDGDAVVASGTIC